MPLLDLPDEIYIPRPIPASGGNLNFTSNLIDALDEGIATILQIKRAGSIRQIGFTTGAVTTTGDLLCALETTTGAPATPSGTLWGTNTSATVSVADTDDNVWKWSGAFTADASVSRGDVVAAVVRRPSGSAFNGNLRSSGNNWSQLTGLPYLAVRNTGSWVLSGAHCFMALRYSDDSVDYYPHVWPLYQANTVVFDSSSAQDEVGQTFILPFAYRITGYWIYALSQAAVTADFDVRIYDETATPTTSLVTDSVTYSHVQDFDTGYIRFRYFPNTIDVPANTIRRLMVRPTDADDVTLYAMVANDAQSYEGFEWGDTIYRTSREKDTPGAWDEHSKLQRLSVGLIISAIDTSTPLAEAVFNHGMV